MELTSHTQTERVCDSYDIGSDATRTYGYSTSITTSASAGSPLLILGLGVFHLSTVTPATTTVNTFSLLSAADYRLFVNVISGTESDQSLPYSLLIFISIQPAYCSAYYQDYCQLSTYNRHLRLQFWIRDTHDTEDHLSYIATLRSLSYHLAALPTTTVS